jgi:hypothetical protein
MAGFRIAMSSDNDWRRRFSFDASLLTIARKPMIWTVI